MSKYYVLIILFQLFGLQSFAQKSDADLLKQAYQTGNAQKLYEFCKSWQNELPPISNNGLASLNDTLKEAYALFTEFWSSRYTEKTLSQPWAPFKKDSSFVIVQNNLKVYLSDHQLYFSPHQIDSFILAQIGISLPDSVKSKSFSSDTELDSLIVSSCTWHLKENASPPGVLRTYRDNISPYNSTNYSDPKQLIEVTDFRPQLNLQPQVLYWSKSKYEQIKNPSFNPTTKQKSDPLNAVKFFKFLQKSIALLPVRISQEQVCYSYPETSNYVSSITLDKYLSYALITFYGTNNGYTSLWHREKEGWQYVETISRYMSQE